MAMSMMGFVFYAANYLHPLFCQQMLGWTATWAGLALSPGAVVFVAMMPFMPRPIRTITPRYMVFIGFVVHGLACLVMAHWNLLLPFWRVLGSRIIEIIGLAWLMVPIDVMAFGFLPKEKTTSGSGLLSLARNFGGSCGVSIAETMLARRAQAHQTMLVSHLTPGNQEYQSSLISAAAYLHQRGMSFADAATASIALVEHRMQEQATMLSYVDAYYVLALGSFLAAPIPLFIRKAKTGTAKVQGTCFKGGTVKEQRQRLRLFVCMKTRTDGRPCCAHLGASIVLDELRRQVLEREEQCSHIDVRPSGCLDQCEDGPVVMAFYGQLAEESAPSKELIKASLDEAAYTFTAVSGCDA